MPSPALRRLGIGVEPVWLSLPVSVTCSHFRPWPWVTTPMSMPSSSRIGPCSMCSSKNACILRAPTGSSPFQPIRVSSSPKRLPSRSLRSIGPVLVEHAGEHARSEHRRGKARALFVGPVGDDDRVLGLDAEIVERADHLEPAEHAQHAVDTCRRSAGCRGGCRHRPAARRDRCPRGGRTSCPSGRRPCRAPPPRTSAGTGGGPRRRHRSGSGGCCRRRHPGRSSPSPSANPTNGLN